MFQLITMSRGDFRKSIGSYFHPALKGFCRASSCMQRFGTEKTICDFCHQGNSLKSQNLEP